MRRIVACFCVSLSAGGLLMLAEINAWLEHEPNLWFLVIVGFIGAFWDFIVTQPLAQLRTRRFLLYWLAIYGLKKHSEQQTKKT